MKPSDLLAEAISNVPAPTLEAVQRIREKMLERLREDGKSSIGSMSVPVSMLGAAEAFAETMVELAKKDAEEEFPCDDVTF